MSENLDELLEWMKVQSRTFSWDYIVALDRSKLNQLLHHEYVRRFAANSYFPALSHAVWTDDQFVKYYLHDFVLDRPQLSFENADLNDSKARLSMNVLSGSQIALTRDGRSYRVRRIHRASPLQGPVLSLQLELPQTPGIIEAEGRVQLDLRDSDDFKLTLDDEHESPDDERWAGAVFSDLFNELEPDKRVFLLGKIDPEQPDFLRPRAFVLRTQAAAAGNGDGAIVLFISCKHGHAARPPGAGADFRYLIPNDPAGYSAAALVDWQRLMVFKVAQALGKWLPDGSMPELVYENDKLVGMKLERFAIPMLPFVGLPYVFGGKPYQVTVLATAFSPVTFFLLQFDANKLSVTCRLSSVITELGYWGNELHRRSEYVQDVDVMIDYRFTGDPSPKLIVESMDTQWVDNDDSDDISRHQERVDESIKEGLLGFWEGAAFFTFLAAQTVFAYASFNSQLGLGLALQNGLSLDVEPLLKKLMSLNFGQTLNIAQTRAPFDVVGFGHVAQSASTGVIAPDWPTLAVGGSQRFAIGEPTGAIWALQPLEPGGPVLGSIGRTDGLYRAPSSLSGQFLRERITVTTAAGAVGETIVTVAPEPLLVAPQVVATTAAQSLTLKAFSTDSTAVIKWAFTGTSGGKVMPETGAQVTYTAPAMDPFKYFVIETIEVSDGTYTQTIKLITHMVPSGLEVRIEKVESERGRVHFKALREGVEQPFTLAILEQGPGAIVNENGRDYYQASEAAKDPYVIIEVNTVDAEGDRYDNFYILPLPVKGLEALYQELAKELP